MKKKITLILVIVLLLAQSAYALDFSDITAHWSKKHVNRLSAHQIINGYPDGSFKPQKSVSIAESIKLLVASMRYKTDTNSAVWYAPYFKTAQNKRLIKQANDYLVNEPNRAITRIEFIDVLNNLLDAAYSVSTIPNDEPNFSDQVTTKAVQRVYALGIIKGYPDGTLRPNKTMTRAEMSAVFDRLFFGKYNQYGDLDTLPIFDTYVKQFDAINQQRYTQLKNGQPQTGTHLNQNLGKYEEIEGMDNFLSQYQKDKSEKALIDVRPQADYDYGHLKGSQHKKLGAVMQGEDVATVYLVVDEARLTTGDKNVLKQAYKQVVVYQMDDTVLEKGSPYLPLLDGAFRQAGNPKIPAYLEKRFDAVAKAYDLTWSDEDFKTWWETSTEEEKSKYLFPLTGWDRRNTPVINFDKKTVMLSDNTQTPRRSEPKDPDDPAKYTLGIDDMAYISYELYKRNIDYFMHDGADWGRIDISYMDDMGKYGIFVKVMDPIKDYGNYESLHMYVDGSDGIKYGDKFGYWLKNRHDEELYMWSDEFREPATYVINNIKLNMQLIHGMAIGSQVYDNYMLSYGLTADEFNKKYGKQEIDRYSVEHFRANGYQIVYKDK